MHFRIVEHGSDLKNGRETQTRAAASEARTQTRAAA